MLFAFLHPEPYARQPLTLAMCSEDHFHIENFSLDLSDVGMTEFFAGVKQTRPRLLHDIAAQDPVAGGKFVIAAYRFRIAASRFPLPKYRFRITASELPLPKCRFRITASEMPLPNYRFRNAASELPRLKNVLSALWCFIYYIIKLQ